MATEKMTYAKAVRYAIDNLSDAPADVMEKLKALVESVEKRAATKSTKPTKTQRENAPIKDAIVNYLKTCTEAQTCGDIRNGIPALADATPQKISALLRQLCKDEGTVERFVDKRTTYFRAK